MALLENQLTTSVSYKTFTCIPTYLLDLLKLKANDEKSLRHQTLQIINLHPDFLYTITLLHGSDKTLKAIDIVNRYNFEHFCEMIISTVIHKKLSGAYLKKFDFEIPRKIEELTKKIRPNGLSSNPRINLLFTYLILSAIDDHGPKHLWRYAEDFSKKISPLQGYINTNIYESDWMLFTLKLVDEAVGSSNLVAHIRKKTTLNSILSTLNLQTRNTVIKSLINYANSIGEEHLLCQDFI